MHALYLKKNMYRYTFGFCIIIISFSFGKDISAQEECPLLVAYTPFSHLDRYDQIDWQLITHMNTSALRMDYNGNLKFPGFDSTLFQQFVDYGREQNPDVKISFSVSSFLPDFESVEIFSAVAADSIASQNLIEQMVALTAYYDLDGCDVDWEFPLNNVDKWNLIKLIKGLRKGLSELSQTTGKHYEVSMAVGGAWFHAALFYLPQLIDVLDFAFIMNYDDVLRSHHSTYESMIEGLNVYNVIYKWPFEKMVMGVPFYGLNQDEVFSPKSKTYIEIAASDPEYYYYNESDNAGDRFYYNSMTTITKKMKYFMNKGGLGMGMWAVTFDRMKEEYSLLQGMHDSLQAYCEELATPILNNNLVEENFIVGNPVRENLLLQEDLIQKYAIKELKLVDLFGREVFSTNSIDQNIDISFMAIGSYVALFFDEKKLITSNKIVKL